MVNLELINAIKAKDELAFQKMYETCFAYVYSIIRKYVTNELDHKDLIQDVFARVFLSINTYDSEKGQFKFWLRKITINICIAHLRLANNSKNESIDLVENIPSDIDINRFDLTKSEIKNLLNGMPKQYQNIIILIVVDEYTHLEISELLGISTKTSRLLLYRAMKWLKTHLKNNSKSYLATELKIQFK